MEHHRCHVLFSDQQSKDAETFHQMLGQSVNFQQHNKLPSPPPPPLDLSCCDMASKNGQVWLRKHAAAALLLFRSSSRKAKHGTKYTLHAGYRVREYMDRAILLALSRPWGQSYEV